jgi:hypothetical protein
MFCCLLVSSSDQEPLLERSFFHLFSSEEWEHLCIKQTKCFIRITKILEVELMEWILFKYKGVMDISGYLPVFFKPVRK